MPALIARVGTDKYTVGNRRFARPITLRSAVAVAPPPHTRLIKVSGRVIAASPTPGDGNTHLNQDGSRNPSPRMVPVTCAEHERVVLASNVYGCQRCRHGTVHTRHYETRDAQTPTKKM